jgi:cholesterol transport system auxiliary component
MKIIAAYAIYTWTIGCFYLKNSLQSTLEHLRSIVLPLFAIALTITLAACATPQAPVVKAVYDFGPTLTPSVAASAPLMAASSPSSATATNAAPALGLADVDAVVALQSNSMFYRLGYANPQQLRPYALATWAMPPAQLLRTRLRDALSTRGPVVSTAEAAPAWQLRIELDEFSQWFDTPASSSGLVSLRASLMLGNIVSAQRSFSASAIAQTQDAIGGVNALTAASDDIAQQIVRWSTSIMLK